MDSATRELIVLLMLGVTELCEKFGVDLDTDEGDIRFVVEGKVMSLSAIMERGIAAAYPIKKD